LPFSAELAQFEIAKQFAHAMGYIDRLVRPGHALGGEQRCKHAVAGGVTAREAGKGQAGLVHCHFLRRLQHLRLRGVDLLDRGLGRRRQQVVDQVLHDGELVGLLGPPLFPGLGRRLELRRP
jgi:hypothetical protein